MPRPIRLISRELDWPIEGVKTFRGPSIELRISDLFSNDWLLPELERHALERGYESEIISLWNYGFEDDFELGRVTAVDVECARLADPRRAHDWSQVVMANGQRIPTPEQVRAEFVAVLADALTVGTIEMEYE